MNYQINEGQLQLINDFIDESVNIIKFPSLKASLVITRTVLNSKQTAESYFLEQTAALKKTMKNFLMSERTPTVLGNDKATPIAALESQLQFEQKGVVLHQFLLTAQWPTPAHLLVFTYAQARPFNNDDEAHWQAIKAAFIAKQ